MSQGTSVGQSDERSGVRSGVVTRMSQVGVQMVVLAAVLFFSSGRLDWGMAWAYVGVSVLDIAVNTLVLLRRGPGLMAERLQVQEGTPGWDRTLMGLYGLMGMLALLVCGLDERWGWSQAVPPALQWGALGLYALGDALASWAMLANSFFAATVRIQHERGHALVSRGPYRYVRHPGYSGWMVCNLVAPLALDSLWALIPAALTVGFLLVRTLFEDRMLCAELAGYGAYARRVRYRLLPGVW